MKPPPTPLDIPHLSAVMSAIARRTSKARAAASRRNGKKGGRPKKNKEAKP